MSHPEQRAFLALVCSANTQLIEGGRVLEIGSYDVNGSVRGIFGTAADYVGIDLTDGPGVDRVAYGHEVDDPDESYDVTVSGECFEHDPHYAETFANMVRLTRRGGLVTFTCASIGRPEHGTRRTMVSESPGTQAVGLDYYRNLSQDDFAGLGLEQAFSQWRFWYEPTTFDLYFVGVRGGADTTARLPNDADVGAIGGMMTFPYRAIRWPLRIALRLTGGGTTYQRIVLPYWRFALGALHWAERMSCSGVRPTRDEGASA